MIHDGKDTFFIPFAPDSVMLVVYLPLLSRIEVLDCFVLLRKSSSILLNGGSIIYSWHAISWSLACACNTCKRNIVDKFFVLCSTDGQAKSSSIGKRILDSISAPPAFASEFPAHLRKSLAPISGSRSNTFHVSAEVISIGSLAVASGPDKWSLQKNQGMELLITDFEPGTRIHCGCSAITTVLRGGFCLVFFSAIMLLVSYEVGMCIYGK